MGFAHGIREDYSYGACSLPNVAYPVGGLDNDFYNLDINRHLDYFQIYDPSVGNIGDAYTPAEAKGLNNNPTRLKEIENMLEIIVKDELEDGSP